MKAHRNHVLNRLISAAMRSPCRYRVCALGYDHRNRIIGISVNTPRGYEHTTDPTTEQFPPKGTGVYEKFDGVAECENCGKRLEKKISSCVVYPCCSWSVIRYVWQA